MFAKNKKNAMGGHPMCEIKLSNRASSEKVISLIFQSLIIYYMAKAF
jgi:hypothetical protein